MTRTEIEIAGMALGLEGVDLDFYIALALGEIDGDIVEAGDDVPDEEVSAE
jgi:hypothetical protein